MKIGYCCSNAQFTVGQRYVDLINNCGLDLHEKRFGDFTSLYHLKWMIFQVFIDSKQSATKKHRWMGYVQGMLVAYGLVKVMGERDLTRDVFNGE